MSLFFPVTFKIFSLCLTLENLLIICLNASYFIYVTFLASCIWMFTSFSRYGNGWSIWWCHIKSVGFLQSYFILFVWLDNFNDLSFSSLIFLLDWVCFWSYLWNISVQSLCYLASDFYLVLFYGLSFCSCIVFLISFSYLCFIVSFTYYKTYFKLFSCIHKSPFL
jgi:hypothetical protein